MKRTNLPCPSCGSSDALTRYEDGTYCFSCKASVRFHLTDEEKSAYNRYMLFDDVLKIPDSKLTKDITTMTKQYVAHRGIKLDTFKKYLSPTYVNDDGEPKYIQLQYGNDCFITRSVDGQKEYKFHGDSVDSKLFGQEMFNAGSSKSITICEGAIDAMSVYDMLGGYPSVAVRSASTALSDCKKAFNYLNSFDNIYICFDNDRPGQDAAKEVAALFNVNKVFPVKLDKFKDANDFLTNNATKEFVATWWNTTKFMPKGIVNSFKAFEEILGTESKKSLATYPFPTLEGMTDGVRDGELVLITAPEGVGKTEILRAVEYHLLKTTESNLGIIHLEETEKRSIEGLISYVKEVPVHLSDCPISKEDKVQALKELCKQDDRLHLYQHFGSDDPNTIVDVIRYMVAVQGCKYIFLDHITMLVTGFEGDDERKKLDYISTRLAMLTRELNFTLFLVSHVNDLGQTRGSRNISKVADLVVHLSRDLEADTIEERNQTHLMVKKNRWSGRTGPAGNLFFDPKTYTIKELEYVMEDKDTNVKVSPF